MLRSVLIANRGEIACRIAHTAKRLGMRTIAVYSEADAGALHTRSCDEAYLIGGSEPRASYLAIDHLIAAAKQARAECVHPGYGFLSENADFADACAQAGLVFVGPPASAIRAMGLKDHAKKLMERAGVPVVPGYHGDRQDTKFLKEKAYQIGYPVLIKPADGGGGRGMRLVDKHADFDAALEGAVRESQSAWNQPSLDREICSFPPAHRNSGLRRQPRQRGSSWRARLFAAAAPPESDRGGAGAGHDTGIARGDWQGGGRRRKGGRLPRRGYGGIRRGRHRRTARQRILVHRNEHAAAGRASSDRGGDRPRSGRMAVPHRRRGKAAAAPGRSPLCGTGDRGARLCRRSRTRLSAVHRDNRGAGISARDPGR